MTRGAQDAAISAGRDAWKRLRERERTTWEDWLAVARALAIGRTAALQKAGTNRAVGTTYNREMARWLKEHGLSDVCAQERYRALLCLENLNAIEAFREGLDDAQCRRLNHPNAVWFAWRGASKGEKPAPKLPRRQSVPAASKGQKGYGRSVYWPQDAMRRAHRAMLDSRSTDLLTLARVALQAAIRSQADLLELLPPEFPARPAPKRSVETSPAHATAA